MPTLLATAPLIGHAATNLVANGGFESIPFAVSGYDGSYCYVNGTTFGCGAQLPGWSAFAPVMTSTSGAWGAAPDTPADTFRSVCRRTARSARSSRCRARARTR